MGDPKESQTPEISIDLDQLIDGSSSEKKSENMAVAFSDKKNDTVNLAHITLESAKKDTIVFGDSRDSYDVGSLKVSYWKRIFFSFGFLAVTVISLLILIFYQRYFTEASKNHVSENALPVINAYKKVSRFVDFYLPFQGFTYYNDLPFDNKSAVLSINDVVGSDSINYIDKKDILTKASGILGTQLVNIYNDVDTTKKKIGRNAFFSKEIEDLIIDPDASLQRSLLSLEAIKFSTALKIFSYLESFLTQFSQSYGFSLPTVRVAIDGLLRRGEKDLTAYLFYCYFNPYENPETCTKFGDFDASYRYAQEPNFDSRFFISLMRFVDQKLENTDFPSFNLSFQNFDPTSSNITIQIQINTFQQDELELLSKGIFNPHIFMVTHLIQLLKQSLIIVGENIDLTKLKVTKKTLKIGGIDFVVNTSSLTFAVPLQKTTQREIFDYVNEDF
ncbi:MAG TPA: hypothetical protein PKD96_02520 [Candidatus Absconditabacterales bacterium]|nr:hypothetical protein [Candidatus Absconditabacterales bacterium]HMT27155.1 hypothetical protein [Candidatus Absconditabacterales bacterium]